MPLNGKMNAGDICEVLKQKTNESVKLLSTYVGGATRPCYYQFNQTIILSPATDIRSPYLPSITDVIIQAKEALIEAHTQGRSFILLIAQQQNRLLDYFPRNHWVTLHFDPALKICTLIDSRPESYSILYPLPMIWRMLNDGLEAIGLGGSEIVYHQVYQSVQYNDVYCGAWALTNILALVGAMDDNVGPLSVEALKTAYSWQNEVDVVNRIIKLSGKNIPTLVPLSGFMARTLSFFGVLTYATIEQSLAPEEPASPASSSHAQMGSILGYVNPAALENSPPVERHKTDKEQARPQAPSYQPGQRPSLDNALSNCTLRPEIL